MGEYDKVESCTAHRPAQCMKTYTCSFSLIGSIYLQTEVNFKDKLEFLVRDVVKSDIRHQQIYETDVLRVREEQS